MVAIVRATGPNFTDPREFYRSIIDPANANSIDTGGTVNIASVAGFFTEQSVRGISDNTNWTAATYKTLLSIPSGKGLVSNIIGPTGLAGTPTTTFEITVDGVVTVIAVTATAITQRAILGATGLGAGNLYITTKVPFSGAQALDAGKAVPLLGTTAMWPWQSIRSFGIPCLIYQNSLLIRAQSSESNSTTTNQERQSAVQYMSMS